MVRVNILSETPFTFKNHGMHYAFLEHVEGLKRFGGIDVAINSFRDADVVHCHTAGPYCLLALKKFKGRTVMTVHAVPESIIGAFPLWRYWIRSFNLYLKFVYNKATVLLAVSPSVERTLWDMGVKSRIVAIGNYVDRARFRRIPELRGGFRRKYGIGPRDVVVLFVGQVIPKKGVETFIEVSKMLPDYKFVWTGGRPWGLVQDGYFRMGRLMRGKYPNLIFTGFVPDDEMVGIYNMADIFFSPSYQECFGLSNLEAASCGLPLILRDIKDYEGTFADYALLGRGEEDFARAIVRLSEDRSLYDEYVRKSEEVARKFDERRILRGLVDLYRSLVEEGGGR
ncbi:MAG: glycosyltransferase family 4 protein [bacterium]